jgi:hypothetical protein
LARCLSTAVIMAFLARLLICFGVFDPLYTPDALSSGAMPKYIAKLASDSKRLMSSISPANSAQLVLPKPGIVLSNLPILLRLLIQAFYRHLL